MYYCFRFRLGAEGDWQKKTRTIKKTIFIHNLISLICDKLETSTCMYPSIPSCLVTCHYYSQSLQSKVKSPKRTSICKVCLREKFILFWEKLFGKNSFFWSRLSSKWHDGENLPVALLDKYITGRNYIRSFVSMFWIFWFRFQFCPLQIQKQWCSLLMLLRMRPAMTNE